MGYLYRPKFKRRNGTVYESPNWHLQYYVNGRAVRESTGTPDEQKARQVLLEREDAAKKAIRPRRRRRRAACTCCGATARRVLDHNHLTGEERGRVCAACNARIGHFEFAVNDRSRAQQVVQYLLRFDTLWRQALLERLRHHHLRHQEGY